MYAILLTLSDQDISRAKAETQNKKRKKKHTKGQLDDWINQQPGPVGGKCWGTLEISSDLIAADFWITRILFILFILFAYLNSGVVLQTLAGT